MEAVQVERLQVPRKRCGKIFRRNVDCIPRRVRARNLGAAKTLHRNVYYIPTACEGPEPGAAKCCAEMSTASHGVVKRPEPAQICRLRPMARYYISRGRLTWTLREVTPPGLAPGIDIGSGDMVPSQPAGRLCGHCKEASTRQQLRVSFAAGGYHCGRDD